MTSWEAKDKTFIITGGASGLGAEYVRIFLEQGAKKIAILDIAEDVGKTAVDKFNKAHGEKVIFIKCDVSKEEDISNAFDEVVSQFVQIDVIVNNAGIMVDAPHLWRTASDVNYQGLVSFTLKGINHMRKDEGGSGGTIINISSVAAIDKFPFLPIYNGAKLAVLHFSQCIAMDPFYDNTGIRILTICYGPTDTPLLHNLSTRTYHPKLGQVFDEFTAAVVKASDALIQKVESAVSSFDHMCKHGAPGSIWLAASNKPPQDITPLIDRVFGELTAVVRGEVP